MTTKGHLRILVPELFKATDEHVVYELYIVVRQPANPVRSWYSPGTSLLARMRIGGEQAVPISWLVPAA